MKISNGKIKASKGMILTNGVAFGISVVLGVTDSPENWREITIEEYIAVTQVQE